jgi:hypothetical protein
MNGSLSMANTAVSLANVAVVDSVEIGWFAVYSRYYNGVTSQNTAFFIATILKTSNLTWIIHIEHVYA